MCSDVRAYLHKLHTHDLEIHGSDAEDETEEPELNIADPQGYLHMCIPHISVKTITGRLPNPTTKLMDHSIK